MLEEYYKYKSIYNNYIILIKSGNFYEILDKDAIVINRIFNYKLSQISNTIKCGFPISSLDKVLNKIKDIRINYVVIVNGKISLKENFEDNKYNNFQFDINKIKYNYIKINKITKFLKDNAYNDIGQLLENIENLIKNENEM